jgi:hypothetical protein
MIAEVNGPKIHCPRCGRDVESLVCGHCGSTLESWQADLYGAAIRQIAKLGGVRCGGIALAHFSPMHVDRLVTFLRSAMQTGRIFVADHYTAFVMYLIRRQCKIPDPQKSRRMRVADAHDAVGRIETFFVDVDDENLKIVGYHPVDGSLRHGPRDRVRWLPDDPESG